MRVCVPNLIFYKHMLSAESQRSESVLARNKSSERVEIYMGVRNVFTGSSHSISEHHINAADCIVQYCRFFTLKIDLNSFTTGQRGKENKSGGSQSEDA